MQAQKMSPIWYWVSPIWSDLLRFGQIWSDLVIRVTDTGVSIDRVPDFYTSLWEAFAGRHFYITYHVLGHHHHHLRLISSCQNATCII